MTQSEPRPPVDAWIEARVGILELARPDMHNCLSLATVEGIVEALDAWESDPEVRAVLVRAQGRNFCTGADLAEVELRRYNPARMAAFIKAGHAALSRLEASPLPVVAAVQGLCLAGGLELALAADMVFAARGARFGDQHAQYGLVPGWGGSQRLPRAIGLNRALDLCFSARWIDAATAEAWGLVARVVDDEALHAEALGFCAALAERSAPGLAAMKRLARRGLEGTLEAGLAMEAEAVVRALASADVTEGLAAFKARRKPAFG